VSCDVAYFVMYAEKWRPIATMTATGTCDTTIDNCENNS
jgi:hypothetical protein